MQIALICTEQLIVNSTTDIKEIIPCLLSLGHNVHVITPSETNNTYSILEQQIFIHYVGYPIEWRSFSQSVLNLMILRSLCGKLQDLKMKAIVDILLLRESQYIPQQHLGSLTAIRLSSSDATYSACTLKDILVRQLHRFQISVDERSQTDHVSPQIEYQPVISILVVAYNALQYTQTLVKSIREHTFHKYILNILDNGSTDGTRDWLLSIMEDPDIFAVFSNDNKGCAGGRNILLENGILGDFVLFIDNDCIVGKDWDINLIQQYKSNPRLGILGARGYHITVSEDDRKTYTVSRGAVDIVTGFFMFMRRALVELLGKFDDQIAPFWHEDDDYCVRSKAHGFENIIYPARVLHFEHKSSDLAGIVQDENSCMAVARRRHLVAKWKRNMYVNEDVVSFQGDFEYILDRILVSQVEGGLRTGDTYKVRSAVDLLLGTGLSLNPTLISELVNYMEQQNMLDFVKHLNKMAT